MASQVFRASEADAIVLAGRQWTLERLSVVVVMLSGRMSVRFQHFRSYPSPYLYFAMVEKVSRHLRKSQESVRCGACRLQLVGSASFDTCDTFDKVGLDDGVALRDKSDEPGLELGLVEEDSKGRSKERISDLQKSVVSW